MLDIYCVLNVSFLPSGVVVGAGMVVGTDNNELKTKKLYFLAQDNPGVSFLKYFMCFHFILKSSLFCFISSSSSSSSSSLSLYHHHYLRYCLISISLLPWGVVVGDGIVVGTEKWKRTICNPNNICKQDIF